MMIITTTEHIADERGNNVPYRTIDRAFGITTVSPSAFANWKTSFRNVIGGEAKSYTNVIAKSREQAMDRLEKEARQEGGNAVVQLRFDSDSITGDLETVVAYGTAVKLL